MSTEDIDEVPCIGCGTILRKRHGLNSDKPSSPGDISICWHCGLITMLDNDLKRRNLTAEEATALKDDPKFIAVLRTIADRLPKVH